MSSEQRDTPLPWSLKASWGIGGLGTTSMLYLVNMFVVFFLVRHVGISAAIAASLFAFTRWYDAIIDPLIGTLSDRTRGNHGRRRPWMLVGAVLCPIACVAVFNPPQWEPGYPLYTAVMAALLLYCTAYSLFAIPYMALGAEMTDDYRDRASLMAWRTFFVFASGIVITAGAPALIAQLGGDRAAYATMSWVAAATVGATLLWVVFFTRGARERPRAEQRTGGLKSLRSAAANKPFFIILLVKMTGQLGTAFLGASTLFFFVEVLRRDEKAMALLGLVANLVGVAAVPLWNRVLHRVERKPLLAALLGCLALAYLSWILATPQESQTVFVLRAAAIGACSSGTVLLAMSMLADTIEYDRLTTGESREGLYVGAYELMQTTSFVVAPLLAGFAFSLAGLIPGDAGHGNQPESALDMIRLAMSIVPASCSALGVLLTLYYPLDGKRLAELRAAALADAQRSPPAPDSMNASASRAVR